jgi:serine/threonine-protein kinase
MMNAPVPFGRYKLLNLLGEGGMAKVYRALLSGPMGFEKEVALKRLDAKLTSDERVLKALINEALLGGQLKHNNIVEIYEFNHVDDHYFMAMEYVDGWTLDALVRRCRDRREFLPPSIVYEIIVNICRGLEYAHALRDKTGRPLNLVHRDLKPGNIMISREGDVKLMDFGIAKADSNLYKTTVADVTKGTPVYMSPEQVTGAKLDQRSDLFSLGSILVELITNESPFSAANLLAIMHAVLNADISKPMQTVQERIPQFADMVEKTMAKDRDDRFDSAAEMTKALRKLRRDLQPGPTLAEWLEDNMAELPEAATTGEFGPAGAPRPVTPRGTQSLAAIAALDAEASVLSLHRSGETEPRREEPSVSVGDAGAGGETVGAPSVDELAPVAKKPLGRMTREFFASESAVASGSPSDVGVTRIQPPVPRPASGVKKRPKSRGKSGRNRRPKRKTNRRLIGVAGTAALLAIAFVAVVASRQDVPDPVDPDVEVAPVVVAPAVESTPAVVESTPELTPEPTPVVVAPTPKPVRVAPTPARPTPAVVAAATPEPPKLTGTVMVNAKPWANLLLDGAPFGRTPRKNVPVPAGKHTLQFDCANCDPPQRQTVTFTLEPGGRFKKIVKFPDQ